MLGAGGFLRNLLAQVGGSAMVGGYRRRYRRGHDDQVHDGFPFLVVGGLLLTPDRRYLKRPRLWCGVVVANLIMLPNIVWQIQHHFVSLECRRTVHAHDIARGWKNSFLVNQFRKSTQVVTVAPILRGAWVRLRNPRRQALPHAAGCV